MTVLVNNTPPVVVRIERRDPLVVRYERPIFVMQPTINTGAGGGGSSSGSGVEPYVSGVFGAAMTWVINHNLGRRVDVALFTTGSVKMSAEVVLISDNQAVANFSAPTAGFARVI